MFCPNCGNQLPDDAQFCPKCGKGFSQPRPKRIRTEYAPGYFVNGKEVTNTIAVVGFILSFFIMIAGLVCSIIGYNNAKRGAPFKGFAIAGILLSSGGMIIAFIWFLAAL